jgi:putative peptide zinc metalloprotease protein
MARPRLRRRVLALLTATGLAWGGFAASTPTPAGAADGDNIVVAINTKDGSTKFKISFKIHLANGDVITTTNAAVAIASCTDCRTIAVAFQVLLLTGDPSVIAPTNLAIAMNVGCDTCETLASAYQYVLSTNGHVKFTKAGKDEIRAIKKALKRLEKAEGMTLAEIQAELDALANRLLVVLTHEIVVAGPPDENGDTNDEHPFEDAVGEDGRPLADEAPTTTTTSDPSATTTTTSTTSTTAG